jgi:hypothetical protein
VAQELEADRPCAALPEAEALQRRTIAAVNAGRVPARYQEELTSSVGALVARISCVPPPPPPATTADEDADEPEDEDEAEESDEDGDDGKGKQKGKKKGKKKGKGGKG